jgi:hypothetical protein
MTYESLTPGDIVLDPRKGTFLLLEKERLPTRNIMLRWVELEDGRHVSTYHQTTEHGFSPRVLVGEVLLSKKRDRTDANR